MSKPQVKIYNPQGRNGYTSLKCAQKHVKRGGARWKVEDEIVEFIRDGAVATASLCEPSVKLFTPPATSPNLPPTVSLPAFIFDSQLGQTFLQYPQRSRDSYSGAYPALRQRGAGLG